MGPINIIPPNIGETCACEYGVMRKREDSIKINPNRINAIPIINGLSFII
jgi:hypothetical protein